MLYSVNTKCSSLRKILYSLNVSVIIIKVEIIPMSLVSWEDWVLPIEGEDEMVGWHDQLDGHECE